MTAISKLRSNKTATRTNVDRMIGPSVLCVVLAPSMSTSPSELPANCFRSASPKVLVSSKVLPKTKNSRLPNANKTMMRTMKNSHN